MNFRVNTYMMYLLLCGSRYSIPPEFGAINPSQGRQEETLSITITAINTTFQVDGVTDIIFSPTDGIEVAQISVQSNTELQCQITIATDAPVGIKTVTVIWDDGKKAITGNNVFEVLNGGWDNRW